MSRLNSTNELPTYFVPKPIYDQAMDDIEKKSESHNKKPKFIISHCHLKRYRYFNTQEPAQSHANTLEAAHQAFEDRNFRVLYEIIHKGLDKRDLYISTQLFEYLYAAIEIDPKITNRHEMLVNAVKGYKVLNNDEEAEDFIKRAHLLIKFKKDNNTDESSDIEKEEPLNIKNEMISDEDF
ncbi:hypothetical protein ACKWTF_012748 [Chironomus riparius]